jgi:hypothetical protein
MLTSLRYSQNATTRALEIFDRGERLELEAYTDADRSPQVNSRVRGLNLWFVWVPVFISLVLINYDRYGLDGDEAASRWYAAMPYASMLAHMRHFDAADTLYYSVLHLWALGGHSSQFLRALALIFALASLVVVYRIAALLFDRATAVWSVGVLSTSFMFVTYASDLRTYSMEFLFCSLAALYIVRAMYVPGDERAPLLFACWSVAALLAHPMAVAWIAALLIGALAFAPERESIARRLRRPSLAIVLLGIGPVAIATRLNGTGGIAFIGPLTFGKIVDSLTYFSGGGSAIIGLLLAALVVCGLMRAPAAQRSKLYLVVFWLFCSIAVMIAISTRVDVMEPRYYIHAWIALCIACGAGVRSLASRQSLYAGGFILAALIALNAYVLASNPWRHEDWRAAVALLRGRMAPSDAIVIYTGRYIRPVYYALQETGENAYASQIVFPRTGVNYNGEPPPPTLPEDLSRRHTTVWLMLSHEKAHPSAVISALLQRYRHTEVHVFNLLRVARLSDPE